MPKLKRFGLMCDRHHNCNCHMVECDDGTYVRYNDIELVVSNVLKSILQEPIPADTQEIQETTCCRSCWEKKHKTMAQGSLNVLWNPIGMPMIVCSQCGNKRCPHATDHEKPCTGSNEPGQEGSSY